VKDFDVLRKQREAQDRMFQIGGETFVRRASVRPEAVEPWESVGSNPDITSGDVIARMDETVINLIEPGPKGEAHKRWKALRAREDDAVNLGDMIDVITWLVEEQSARPTQSPGSFSGEPDTTGTPSTGASSPPVLQEVSTA